MIVRIKVGRIAQAFKVDHRPSTTLNVFLCSDEGVEVKEIDLYDFSYFEGDLVDIRLPGADVRQFAQAEDVEAIRLLQGMMEAVRFRQLGQIENNMEALQKWLDLAKEGARSDSV